MNTHTLAPVRRFLSLSISSTLCLVGLLLCRNAAHAGILAHFRFDEEGGTIATNSVGSVHGTLSSTGAGFAPGGVSGNALQLDRALNGHVLVGDQFGFSIGDFTVVAWVKTQPGDTAPDTVVLGKHQAGIENGYFLFLNTTAGGTIGQAGKASFYAAPTFSTATSATDVNDGVWHQIVVVAQAGEAKSIYVDGAPVEDTGAERPIVENNVPFIVGGIQGSGSPVGLFNGWIDEVQLYDHALSGPDVAFLFRHPDKEAHSQSSPAPERWLVAHWSFDERSGNLAHERVDGHDGTLSETGASFVMDGVARGALQLDRAQNGSVEVGNFFDFQNVDSTMVFWVRTPPGDTTPETVPLSKHEAGFVNGYLFALNNLAGGAAGAPGKVSFFEGSLQARMVSTSDVNDGNWHQVAVVSFVGASRNLYVDGAPLEASRLYSPTVSSLASFIIGGFSQSGQPFGSFTGWIDELQIYQTALSPEDIDFLFLHPTAEIRRPRPNPEGDALLAYWKFDEPDSTTVIDHAGDNHGTLSPTGATIVPGGIDNTALQLDRAANGFANFGDHIPLAGDHLSIVFWLKTAPGYSLDDSVVVGKHESGSDNGYFVVLNRTASGTIGQPGKVSFYTGGVRTSPTSTTAVNDGNWHQIAVVYRAGEEKAIYVDGAPAEDTEVVIPNSGNSAPFLVGGVNFFGRPGGLFSGWVDEVQVYGIALAERDIDFLFQHPGMPLPP